MSCDDACLGMLHLIEDEGALGTLGIILVVILVLILLGVIGFSIG